MIYRVLNQIGWSEWSEITYILAAKVPSVPGSPKLGVVTSTNLQLLLSLSLDNGGSDILSYTLEYTDGTISYSSLLTYTESSTTKLVPISAITPNALRPGVIYFFRVYATNAIGNSDPSAELRTAAS